MAVAAPASKASRMPAFFDSSLRTPRTLVETDWRVARACCRACRRRRQLRGQLAHARLERFIFAGVRVERPPRLRGARRQVLLDARQLLAFGVAEGDRLEHRLLGNLLGAGLDHQHGLLGPRDHELERGGVLLLGGRVHDERAVHLPRPDGADGTIERHARKAEGRRRDVQRQDVGISPDRRR